MNVMPTLLPASPSSDDEVREHTGRLLRHMGLPIMRVVLVDVDSVLYVDGAGRPRTAWLRAVEDELVVDDEPGFCCAHGDSQVGAEGRPVDRVGASGA